ncbi:hypothetical protein FIBSPDRAFT_800184 [Athelia psychrophila]|uniref:Symplekin n=1 Tax=Athelia psychrophila TaxID=1759441 RepID=A0A166AD24_9AGAM|nr:hypothetical protein FIBSPDRAFT_800184 [Fibularhizoctonia sp. CBS 109695]
MAGNPVDPLQALSAALAVPADSKEQADLLSALRESLEAHPHPIPILCTTLIKTVSGAGDSLLKRWVLELLQFAICRSSLTLEARTTLASQSVDTLANLLYDANPSTVKIVIQTFTTVFPLLFRVLCNNRNMRPQWDTLSQCKDRILNLVWSPHVNSGMKLSAVKFMQRLILVETRGVSDPRLQNKNDPNLSFIPADHPFLSAAALEAEGIKLIEHVITTLYQGRSPDILSAILNSWASLVKQRTNMVQLVVSTLTSWTPAGLAGLPASSIKSVEKGIRILLVHISRSPHSSAYNQQIHEALAVQGARMDRASSEEKARKAAVIEAGKKRPISSSAEGSDPKRQKLEQDSSAAFLAGFDFTSLPVALIIELVVANLQAFDEPTLHSLIQSYRGTRSSVVPSPATAPAPPPPPTVPVQEPASAPAKSTPAGPAVKQEPVDPLKMDIDEEEMEYEPDRLNLELSGHGSMADLEIADALDTKVPNLQLINFKIPPPRELTDDERAGLMRNSVSRISTEGQELDVAPSGTSTAELWMLLIVRMITRVTSPPSEEDDSDDGSKEDPMEEDALESSVYARQDQLRRTLCDYIMADFPARIRLATTWMNEEWYNDRIRTQADPTWAANYPTWLNHIVVSYQTFMNGKDKTFARFLLDLPAVPADVNDLLRDLCLDSDKMPVGFMTLREFVVQRPSLRAESLNILLELTTHPEKVTRGAAIITVKRWVPDTQPMDGMVREFALQMLRRLQKRQTEEQKRIASAGDENMEDGQLPAEDLVHSPYLPENIELPADKAVVLQHVELLFALSVKVPEFLDEIFNSYGQMELSVQEAIQELVTNLIGALGSSHGKLLTIMRNCPAGAESLALRVLTIFTERGRPSSQLVAIVKGLISERDLDARFLIPIIAEMDKPDIMKHLPRIVSILNGQTEPKNLVRSVFSSIVTTPSQAFGSVTSNLPRVRQSELLTPVELMVMLHESEKEIGLKSAIEAIGICFSMTDVFRSEILGSVMQQIVDEPVLPVLFLRTVIQAVTTYKSLVGFVSQTLLPRLVTKKVWTNAPLWEGFIRCAKVIAPASFGVLLQLPKEQLREVVDKQPGLKSGLRDYVTKKAGNKARVAGFLEIFGEEPSAQPVEVAPAAVAVAASPA